MKLSTNASNTVDSTADSNFDTFLLSAKRGEDGSWLIVDRQTDVWGHGRSLLEAMCDYWAALFSHIGALDGERLSPRLERQLAAMKRLVEARS